ncbi:MAG: spore gernimation protein, partial [Clostridia bacterium]|nr:spore gernimation protein [Clostridia bacterium]
TEAQAPHFNYFDENGDEHEVWFEDARSIAARIELAAQYNLRGILYWNLMRKNPQNLTVIDSLIKLNN